MKKKTLYIIIATIGFTITSCNNMSKSIEIDYLEKTYFLGKFDKMSQTEIETLKEYYQTEEGKFHLQELEEKHLKNFEGNKRILYENVIERMWIKNIMNNKIATEGEFDNL
jgi:hypothetical protein